MTLIDPITDLLNKQNKPLTNEEILRIATLFQDNEKFEPKNNNIKKFKKIYKFDCGFGTEMELEEVIRTDWIIDIDL